MLERLLDVGDEGLPLGIDKAAAEHDKEEDELLGGGVTEGLAGEQEQRRLSSSNADGEKEGCKKFLVQISCYIHLAVFGILGVLVRYFLQKLFGPGSIGFTNDDTALYIDLPSNMVGSFLMGWLGIVFKGDISRFWDLLAIGLSTGFLGSLTTFSGWNQKMLDLALDGKWVIALIAFSVDMLIVAACLYVGVASANGFRWFVAKVCPRNTTNSNDVDFRFLQTAILFFLALIWCLLWAVSITLFWEGIEVHKNIAKLWFACLVGPPGVWLRWFLARYNGHGLGRSGSLKWIPFGTLYANVLASGLMAGSTTLKIAVNTKICDIIVNGFQLGFLGCLSTVSTFVAEVYAMNQSNHPWRAYVYTLFTILLSFSLGILVYIVPVSAERY